MKEYNTWKKNNYVFRKSKYITWLQYVLNFINKLNLITNMYSGTKIKYKKTPRTFNLQGKNSHFAVTYFFYQFMSKKVSLGVRIYTEDVPNTEIFYAYDLILTSYLAILVNFTLLYQMGSKLVWKF